MGIQPDEPESKPAPLAEPIVISKIWKSRHRTEHVRTELSEHQGHPLINVRIWQTGSDGIDRPTTRGIALTVRKLPELAAAINRALARAKELGLISDDGKAEA